MTASHWLTKEQIAARRFRTVGRDKNVVWNAAILSAARLLESLDKGSSAKVIRLSLLKPPKRAIAKVEETA